MASDKAKGISGRLISAVWDDWRNLDIHAEEVKNSDVYTLRCVIPADWGFDW